MAALVAALAAAAPAAASHAGSFDAGFGGNGVVTTPLQGDGGANAVAPLDDGGFILAGQTAWSGASAFEVAKYRSNGSPDPSFGGGDGYVRVEIGASAMAAGVLARPDGRIVVTGAAFRDGKIQIAVVRLLPDGTLDPSFADGGIFTHAIGGAAMAMASQPGGLNTLVVGGTAQVGPTAGLQDQAFVAMRLRADGTLDPTFGDGGVALATRPGHAYALTVQPDRKVVLAGESLVGGKRVFAAARLNEAGKPDPSFGSGGERLIPIGAGAAATGVVLAPNGSLFLGGNAFTNTAVAATVRLGQSGDLQAGFGVGGISTVATGYGVNGIVRQPDGKLLLPSTGGLNVVRLTATGALDKSFSGDGIAELPVGNRSAANGAAIDPFGRILLAGAVIQNGVGHLAAARLESGIGE